MPDQPKTTPVFIESQHGTVGSGILSDGTTFTFQAFAISAAKVEGQFAPNGEPMYQFMVHGSFHTKAPIKQ